MRHDHTTRRALARARRRAFTVVELMLALALSAVVISAAVGLYHILSVSDRTGQARFEQAAELAVTQITIRKIMNTLVAAPASEEESTTGNPPPEPEEERDEGAGEEDPDAEDQPEQPEGQAAIFAQPKAQTPVMFDLWWQEYDGDEGVVVLPILEVVVSEPPVALRTASERIDEEDLERIDESLTEEALRRTDRLTESVRGRIELAAAHDGWRLRWHPIDPPARPFLLITGIASFEDDGGPALMWEVLSTSEKVDAWEGRWTARIRQEFPLAIRLSFQTNDGEYVDWMFETHVQTAQ